MTEAEIIAIFIRAAEVDRKLPRTEGPAGDRAMNHGYIHDTADMNGWFAEDKRAANWAWLDPKNLRATTNDVGIWEAAMEMMKLVPDPKKRRALWAWSRSEAGGLAFAKWCRQVENPGISRQLGDWRKSSAIECISRAFDRKPLQHNENDVELDFTNQPEIGDKTDTIRVMRPDDARPMACDFDRTLERFDWAATQNARRKEREARKRQAA